MSANRPRTGNRASLSHLTVEAIERTSLAEPVAEHLRGMIVRGELIAGERIPITALAAEMNVSATPLREALKVLAQEGLIELLPNRGARVPPYTAEEARALFEVLASLESLAAELAATRLGPASLAELDGMHAAMRGHFERGEKDPYFALNSRIHEWVVAQSGNPVLVTTHASLMLRATRGRYIAIVDRTRWAEAMEEHEGLLAALHRRDAAAAAAIWREHLTHTGRSVEIVLRQAQEKADL